MPDVANLLRQAIRFVIDILSAVFDAAFTFSSSFYSASSHRYEQASQASAYANTSTPTPSNPSCNPLFNVLKKRTFSLSTQEITLTKLIAEGGFSFVYEATSSESGGNKFACKIANVQTPEQRQAIEKEIAVHERIKEIPDTNILQLLDYSFVSINRLTINFMLFPLMNNGSLRDQIDQRLNNSPINTPFRESHLLESFRTICQSVKVSERAFLEGITLVEEGARGILIAFSTFLGASLRSAPLRSAKLLHAQNITHRDIKPENVLFSNSGTPTLIDLGSAIIGCVKLTSRQDALNLADTAATNSTMSYRAPELFEHGCSYHDEDSVDAKTDVWSLGCLLFAMMYGQSPFECEFARDDSGKVRVCECTYLRVIGKVPTPPKGSEVGRRYRIEVNELVKACLNQVRRERLTISNLLERINELYSSV